MTLPKISQQNKMLVMSFVLLVTCYFLFAPAKKESAKPATQKFYADTVIPPGFVLVPVDLANLESVSALIEQFGVVDLYAGNAMGKGSKKIAAKVKLLRAPLNPRQFAVLVPEDLSNLIMSAQGPFWAIVQNRQTPQDFRPVNKVKPARIEYQQAGG